MKLTSLLFIIALYNLYCSREFKTIAKLPSFPSIRYLLRRVSTPLFYLLFFPFFPFFSIKEHFVLKFRCKSSAITRFVKFRPGVRAIKSVKSARQCSKVKFDISFFRWNARKNFLFVGDNSSTWTSKMEMMSGVRDGGKRLIIFDQGNMGDDSWRNINAIDRTNPY